MQVAVRVDASAAIGAGHVVRCLALAHELQAGGARIRFVCRELTDGTKAQIEARALEVSFISASTPGRRQQPRSGDLLPIDQDDDAADTSTALSDSEWDWLVVDHYALDARWESQLRASARRILVIDDLADRRHDCDILLDQNLIAGMRTRYAARVPQSTRQLLGPEYALLRPEFRELRLQTRPRTGPLKRVLLLFGGEDPRDLTGRALAAIEGLQDHQLEVEVVIGARHARRRELEALCEAANHRCHVQTDSIARLMQVAELAVGASGSSSWERCCLGLPAICIPFADNQRPIARALHEFGACLYIGDEPSVHVGDIARALTELICDRQRHGRMSELAYSLVDGCGATRVFAAMSRST